VLRANQVKDVNNNFAPGGTLAFAPGDNAGWDLPLARDLGTPTTAVVSDSIDDDDTDDVYRISVPSTRTLNVGLSNLSADLNVFVIRDADADGIYDDGDFIVGTFNPGSGDRAFGVTLNQGEYFVWVYRQVASASSSYTMTVQLYTDTTPPTATLDATDMKSAGAPYLDFAVDYADDHNLDGDTSRYWAALDIHAQLDNGADFTFFYFPADNTLNPQFPQNAPNFRTFYRIFAFNAGTGWTANDNGLYTISIHPNTGTDPRVHDAAGNNIPLVTLGSFRIAIGQPDNVAPRVAQVGAPAVRVPGGTTYDFTIDYRDNVAIDGNTVGTGDVRVTGPGGFNQLATLVSLVPVLAPTAGSRRLATYRITAPAGGWQYTHNGAYTISIEPNQVRDTSSNALPAGSVGTLTVHVPFPGDANDDGTVNLGDFNILASNFGQSGRGVATGDFNYDGLVNLADFNILASRFGTSAGPGAFAAAAITPASRMTRMIDMLQAEPPV
jgi:hypothetical protein